MKELDSIVSLVEINGIPAYTEGTIVHMYNDLEFEVEFFAGNHGETLSVEKATVTQVISRYIYATLTAEGYFNIAKIQNKGICGLLRFMFTVGLVYNIEKHGYEGRYYFENLSDAKEALSKWNGVGDPDGDWIKHKGKTEYSNPKYKEL